MPMKTFPTPMGDLRVEVLGHASVRFGIGGKTIYADPYSEVHDFAGDPKADLILITHNHYDHYDEKAFSEIETPETTFIVSENVGRVDGRYMVLANDACCTCYIGSTAKQLRPFLNFVLMLTDAACLLGE